MDIIEEFKEWLNRQHTLSENTRKSYLNCLSKIDLTNRDTMDKSLEKLRKIDANKTYNLRVCALKNVGFFLDEKYENHELIKPIQKLKSKKNTANKHHKPYSKEQVEKILSCASGWRHQALWLALNTGMRRTEIQNLNIQNIDFENGIINVIKGKGQKSREVLINRKDMDVLLDWKEEREFLKDELQHLENNWLFTSSGKRPNLISGNILKQISKKVGFRVKFHSCRSTYATHLFLGTKNLKLIKEQLGHSSIAVTDIYLQPSLKEHQNALESVSLYS